MEDGDHYAYVTLHDCYLYGGFGICMSDSSRRELHQKIKEKFDTFFPSDIYDTHEQGNVFAQYYQYCNNNNINCSKLAADAGYATAQYDWYLKTKDILYLERAANQEHEDSKFPFAREWLRRGNAREAGKWVVKLCNPKLHIFFRCRGSISFEEQYVYGEYIQKQIQLGKDDFEAEHQDLFKKLAFLYTETNRTAKMNVELWLLVSKRIGFIKDLRILIAKYIWKSRVWGDKKK